MQQNPEHSGAATVGTEALGRYLAVERHMLELMHFMDGHGADAAGTPGPGASVGSFASAFGLTKLQAYRKVQQLLGMGLLVVASEQRRRGKPVKLYRCSQRAFFIPSGIISLTELLEDQRHNAKLNAALNLTLGELKIAGVMVSAEAQGQVQMLLVDGAHQPVNPYASGEAALVLNSGEFMLDFAEAKALQQDLFDLLQRYHARQGSGRYQYQILLTPDLRPPPETRDVGSRS